MSRDKFNIQDLLNKGYSLVGDTLVPPPHGQPKELKIDVGFIKETNDKATVSEYVEVGTLISDKGSLEKTIKTEWEIKGNVPSKKNSKRIVMRGKHPLLLPSKLHELYKQQTAMQYTVFGIEFRRAVKHYNLPYPLRVEFTFVRGSKHRADFTNALDTVQDLMVGAKWLPDDDMLHIIPSFQPMYYDKKDCGVLIKLLVNV